MCMHTGIFFFASSSFRIVNKCRCRFVVKYLRLIVALFKLYQMMSFSICMPCFFVAYFDFFSRQFTDFSRHIFRTNSFNDANILTYIPNDINVSQHWHYFPLAMPSSSFMVWMCMSCDCKVHNFQMRFISKFHTRTIQLDTQLEWSHFINVFYFSHEKSNQALSTVFFFIVLTNWDQFVSVGSSTDLQLIRSTEEYNWIKQFYECIHILTMRLRNDSDRIFLWNMNSLFLFFIV